MMKIINVYCTMFYTYRKLTKVNALLITLQLHFKRIIVHIHSYNYYVKYVSFITHISTSRISNKLN